MGAPDIKLS